MRNVLLYSGGVDSYCAMKILEKKVPNLELVYIRYHNPYERKELEKVDLLEQNGRMVHRIDLPALDDSGFNHYFIPMRNLLLASSIIAETFARDPLKKERLNIYFAQVLEIGRDKNTLFWNLFEFIARHIYGYDVKIHRPFHYLEKAELIKKAGVTKEELEKYTYSCYEGKPQTDFPCGCTGCLEKWNAYYQLGWIEEKPENYRSYLLKMNWRLTSPIYLFDLPQLLVMGFKEVRNWIRSRM